LIVERQDQKRVGTVRVKRFGQRAGNIGESADFGEGNCFG